ncbi:MAG TPA: hypothetical protein VJS65_15090 [Verrucomicrobiae bacterium]|nr:hypothetical protein [Verrucomicrobiae bacterium]
MNALVRKEVRLLLPSLSLGLGIVLAPVVLNEFASPGFNALLLAAGVIIALGIALAAFGREFGHGTFSGLLALPVSRVRLWWTKVLVLAGALSLLYVAWWISFNVCAARWPELRRNAADNELTLFTSALFLLTAFSGGLWTTLVFRQIASAIWFAILVPAFLFTTTAALAEYLSPNPAFHRATLSAVALAYGMAGVAFAWWLFLRAEDAQWTGGEVALPKWLRHVKQSAARRVTKTKRPMRALFQKELQLSHGVLMIGGGLAVLHIGVVIIRKLGGGFPDRPTVSALLGAFWGLWFVMPFLVGAAAVAEERKLGTLESQLCLPTGWRRQFLAKFATALCVGIVLGTLPPWVLESATQLPNIFENVPASVGCLISLMIVSGIVSLLSFYASTLARHTLQGAGVGLVLALLGGFIMSWTEWPEHLFHMLLWRGNVAWVIGGPLLAITLFTLSVHNFRCPAITRSIWIRNAAAIALAMGGIMGMASAIYHRAWESVQQSDPSPGTARISLSDPIRLQQDGSLAVLGAGGQLDVFYRSVFVERTFIDTDTRSEHGVHADFGTNWVSVVSELLETIAIRADGTLWVSEQPRLLVKTNTEPPSRMVEAGGNGWKQVIRDSRAHRSIFLLKLDGTLWRWRETNAPDSRKSRLTAPPPYQLGTETNWATLTQFGNRMDLVKTDGSVWSIHSSTRKSRAEAIELEPGLSIDREMDLEGFQWLSGSRLTAYDLGVKTDGTLWLRGRLRWNRGNTMEQLDGATDWKSAAGGFYGALALKSDGSLWKLEFRNWAEPPKIRRLSAHSEWRAVAADINMLYALAADGSIWRWEAAEFRSGGFMAAPSRIPVRIGNVFEPSR